MEGIIFNISEKTAKGYEIPAGRPLRRNGDGVTTLMGISNPGKLPKRDRKGRFVPKLFSRNASCRDTKGKFVPCDFVSNARARKSKKGGATCWSKPRAKYKAMGASRRSDYAYPECFAYPIKARSKKWTKRLVQQARKHFGVWKHRYSPAVRRTIEKRLSEATARRNPEVNSMLVFDTFEENGRRRGRKGRGKSRRRGKARSKRSLSAKSFLISPKGKSMLRAIARRNGDDMGFDFGGEFEENGRRRRGRGKSKRRGKGRKARSWSRGRKASRKWGRKARKGAIRGGKRVQVRRSKRGVTAYVRNPLPFGAGAPMGAGMGSISALFAKYQMAARTRDWPTAVAALQKIAYSPAATVQQKRIAAKALSQINSRLQSGGFSRPGAFSRPSSSLLPIWYKPRVRKPKPPPYSMEAVQALRSGVRPRDLVKAMKGLSEEQAASLFGDYSTFRAFYRSMLGTRRVRRYLGKFRRGSYRSKGKRIRRLSGLLRALRRGKGRGRGRGRKSRKYGRGKRRWSRGYRKSWGRRRGYRRNEGLELMANASGKEILLAVLAGLGGWTLGGVAALVTRMFVKNDWGQVVGSLVGVGASYLLGGKVFDNPLYQKGMLVGSAIPLAFSGYNALTAKKAAAGFGIPSVDMAARYALAGQIQQAAAGPFQQAAAGFQQAAAGYGDYFQPGTGEYVGSGISAVNNFGEYVANNVAIQGWGDYEVTNDIQGGADGFGYVNDGVRPGSDLDGEFAIMEAQAGMGASPVASSSDYLPTVYASPVSQQAAAPDTGIFDVGGSNGIFG